jgi:SAM-dependent methyltransferase
VRSQLAERLGQRFARVTTNAVVRRPGLWRIFRGPMRLQFDRLAPIWDSMRRPDSLASFERALEEIEEEPRRALDLGTGTGAGAFAVASRFPQVEVVGVDLAPAMLAEARDLTPRELAERVRFEQADASRLPYDDRSFDLLSLANMIPFFDEIDRVLAPGGSVIFSFSGGAETPIWVPPERIRSELSRRGFSEFADFQVGRGTSILARKRSPG